jgi:hypothetical protein
LTEALHHRYVMAVAAFVCLPSRPPKPCLSPPAARRAIVATNARQRYRRPKPTSAKLRVMKEVLDDDELGFFSLHASVAAMMRRLRDSKRFQLAIIMFVIAAGVQVGISSYSINSESLNVVLA